MAFNAFDEVVGSPMLDIAPDGSRAMREGKIPWNRINEFIEYVFPSNGLSPPRQYPSTPWLIARAMHIEPWAGDKDVVTSPGLSNLDFDTPNLYEFARVKISYENERAVYTSQLDPVLFLTHSWSVGGEFLLVPPEGLEWADGGFVSEEAKAGVLIPTFEHQMNWPRVQNPPFAAMRACIGRVNIAPMTFSTGIAAPETLLFLGAELRRDILSNGGLAWEVGYRFSERNVPLSEADTVGGSLLGAAISVGGWNHIFRSEDADNNARVEGKTGFYRIWKKESGDPLYGLANLSLLFQGA